MEPMKMIRLICVLGLLMAWANKAEAQNETYGSNDKAGHYLDVGDAKIYYEVYGQGQPVVLLHGGLYGYIDEYEKYIPKLSQQFKVIAVALRGHGRSEIGAKPISYQLFAEDTVAILKKETSDSAIVIGFSDGAITAYVLAANFPAHIRKVVAIGGGLSLSGYSPAGTAWLNNFTPENFAKRNAKFMAERKKLMPQPERWNEFLEKMKAVWTEPVWVSPEKAKEIKCPVLTIGGDRDDFLTTEQFVQTYKAIPNSQLAIIPNAGHTKSMTDPFVFEYIIVPFVMK
jgi:pimeloyl-ACP methyl ester carboxylesterase